MNYAALLSIWLVAPANAWRSVPVAPGVSAIAPAPVAAPAWAPVFQHFSYKLEGASVLIGNSPKAFMTHLLDAAPQSATLGFVAQALEERNLLPDIRSWSPASWDLVKEAVAKAARREFDYRVARIGAFDVRKDPVAEFLVDARELARMRAHDNYRWPTVGALAQVKADRLLAAKQRELWRARGDELRGKMAAMSHALGLPRDPGDVRADDQGSATKKLHLKLAPAAERSPAPKLRSIPLRSLPEPVGPRSPWRAARHLGLPAMLALSALASNGAAFGLALAFTGGTMMGWAAPRLGVLGPLAGQMALLGSVLGAAGVNLTLDERGWLGAAGAVLLAVLGTVRKVAQAPSSEAS